MSSKPNKRVNKNNKIDKHLEFMFDCDLNQTNDTKTDKIRSKIFQLNAIRDQFNSQKAFDNKRSELMAELAQELDRSDRKNTFLTEELIDWTSEGRDGRSVGDFDSGLYNLNEQQICEQLDIEEDNESDDCRITEIVFNESPDNQKTNTSSDNEVQEIYSNCGQNLPKNNLIIKLGSFQKGFENSQKKSCDSTSDVHKRSDSSANRVSGDSRPTISPKANKREKPDDCEDIPPKKTTFITGFQKKIVDKVRKGSLSATDAKKELSKVGSFRPPLKDGDYAAKEPDSEVDPNLKNIDKNLIERIESEIITHSDPISWEDVAGLEFAKKRINEIAILPLKKPHLFTGLRKPPKGILLFGPPGTGKTFLGRLIAFQTQSTFFSITVSALNSKWIGEGEKTIKAMFAVARARQPSVIFIDEIDSLLTTRCDTEHESSRRMKTEFFTQFEGVNTASVDKILIIGATNRPQDLDDAARRRLAARLYIPLPDLSARIKMVKNCLMKERHNLTEEQIQTLAEKTDGYSGADMHQLCCESAMESIRDMDSYNDSEDQLRDITFNDFLINLLKVKPTVRKEDLKLFEEWDRQFGTNDCK